MAGVNNLIKVYLNQPIASLEAGLTSPTQMTRQATFHATRSTKRRSHVKTSANVTTAATIELNRISTCDKMMYSKDFDMKQKQYTKPNIEILEATAEED